MRMLAEAPGVGMMRIWHPSVYLTQKYGQANLNLVFPFTIQRQECVLTQSDKSSILYTIALLSRPKKNCIRGYA